tara:strand:+ start:518 stop:1423 length:906 start_codon:yes stop_codon:yes gene_type:complete
MKQILLSMGALLVMSVNAQITDCSDLFFSEYVEGYGQNKAIEVYNPTPATIDLSDYQIERYSNGATNSSAGGVTNLTGMLVSGDAFVITSGETDTSSTFGFIDPVLFSMSDLAEPVGSYPTPLHMNGNDAMVLTKNGQIIDVIGKVGEDPASGAWTDDAASGFTMGSWWTAQHTLIRKASVKVGDNNGGDLFNPSLEWDSLVVGSWGNLGAHTCDCVGTTEFNDVKEGSYILFPNPANIGEIITITANSKINNIQLVNILGETVLTTNLNKINTTFLSKGTYIALINLSEGEVIENKIIIN